MPAKASKLKATKQSRHQAGYLKFRTRWRHVVETVRKLNDQATRGFPVSSEKTFGFARAKS